MILEEKKKYLVISDLHIGFENTLSSNKVFVGKNSSIKQITNNVKNLIQEENVKSVILLRDVNLVHSQFTKMNGMTSHIFLMKLRKCLRLY